MNKYYVIALDNKWCVIFKMAQAQFFQKNILQKDACYSFLQ